MDNESGSPVSIISMGTYFAYTKPIHLNLPYAYNNNDHPDPSALSSQLNPSNI